MSLLYECINGVIRGGILEGSEGVREGEVIAHLCVEKLRGMLVLDGDPNRKPARSAHYCVIPYADKQLVKYVSLLAFNRIVLSHPRLVSQQQDVFMDCLDDHDISIRLQALDLVSGLVTTENLQLVVNRLVAQLQATPATEEVNVPVPAEFGFSENVNEGNSEEPLEVENKHQYASLAIPDDYRIEVLNRVLDMCSQNTYAAIMSFEWYVDVLVRLLKLVPSLPNRRDYPIGGPTYLLLNREDVSLRIGHELRNISVRVKSVRSKATRVVESLLLIENRATFFPTTTTPGMTVLEPISWVAGEFSEHLATPDQVLSSLIHPLNLEMPPKVLSAYLQAIPKVFVCLTTDLYGWTSAKQADVSILLHRIVKFLQHLTLHPDLDVQERATEFLELFQLTAEAVSTAETPTDEVPLLLSTVLPSLFSGLDLNPVAIGAQQKVPLPDAIDLEKPIRERPSSCVDDLEEEKIATVTNPESKAFYFTPISPRETVLSKESLATGMSLSTSYQQPSQHYQNVPDNNKKMADRKNRNTEDPFYLMQSEDTLGSFISSHRGVRAVNDEDLDIDSIPIVDLDFEKDAIQAGISEAAISKPGFVAERTEIMPDENIDFGEVPSSDQTNALLGSVKNKKVLLEVDSSRLGHLFLESDDGPINGVRDLAMQRSDEDEMARAMAKVERLRLEMQRRSEQIPVEDHIPPEGTAIRRKKRNKLSHPKKQPPKTALASNDTSRSTDPASACGSVAKKKKKKRRSLRLQSNNDAEQIPGSTVGDI